MSYTDYLSKLFEENGNVEQAFPMKKYMKDLFPFLGIKTPARNELLKEFYRISGLLKDPFQADFVLELWDKEEREYQYAALDYIKRSLKKLDKNHLSLMETLIMTKSWWDTVDMLAQHPVGKIASKFPEMIDEHIENWAYGKDMWLQRSAILFQLRYKEDTNELLLYRFIKLHAESKEFFIQKAMGWALREYSKTNSDSVKRFIETNQLPNLTIREGSKYLQ
ncbi:DNA alkylation repair protein [Bacillus sp. Marseille-P3661]|uniref:DNA alkylation repair protein n=1 Tax=Bacillus sp. Marseille-P3661 TaxID=1936234 RepID=UPI000C84B7CB|nr:DNA alkylation repair protein [Bacillus sp. Marseille-P3661]